MQNESPAKMRLLALANHLEQLPNSELDMGYLHMCIRGHAERLFGAGAQQIGPMLGISEDLCNELFFPSWKKMRGSVYYATPQHAARVVRHLAETGRVDWSVARQTWRECLNIWLGAR